MYLDTRDLVEKREELRQEILDAFNEEFETEFADFEELPTLAGDDLGEVDNEVEEQEKLEDFKNLWESELEDIQAIDDIEDVVSEFYSGEVLIREDYFTDYVKDLLEDCGYIPKDFPSWIEIDWEATADNVRQDYMEVEYEGRYYLFRACVKI